MALIPPDVGIRMRMQTETNLLQPITPPRDIPSKLPELRQGQTFFAQIQEALPNNTYKALVAGQQLTLQLAASAKSGDLLELVVVDRSGKVIIAKAADGNAAADGKAAPYPFARFSAAARMIGQLLPAEGERAPPAQLNRSQPLLTEAPRSGAAAAQLAPALARSVAQSGLFYEAHQAQWVTGKLPLSRLLQEPQGQRSAPGAFLLAASTGSGGDAKVGAGGTASAGTPGNTGTASAGTPGNTGTASAGSAGMTGTASAASTTNPAAQSATQPTTLARQMPEDIRPLVQQQLESVATQRMVWQGEVWPRQTMDWEIAWEDERQPTGDDEERSNWRTALSLTMPRLGLVEATLQLTADGVRVTLATPSDASAADLQGGALQLAEALATAGVPLAGFSVDRAEKR